jgi:polar amino acid transport system substrate-binding protein
MAISIMLSESFAEEDIMIVTEEWPPFNYMENGTLTGFSTEIVRNILEIMNKDYVIEMLPSMRTTYVLNTRPHTVMFSLFRTPERESEYGWVGPLCDGSIYFYKRRDNKIKAESLEDLKNVERISCRHAGLIPRLLKKKGFENLDMTATSSLQVYKKLLRGRCDLAISDTDIGVRYCLKGLHADPNVFEKIPVKIFESQLYIAFSKDISGEEIKNWQSALEQLKTNGRYEKIFQKYN